MQPAGDLASLAEDGSLFAATAMEKLEQLQAELLPLADRYDVVVANPPYMGAKNMNKWLGEWVKVHYTDVKGDLFSCFMVRNSEMGNDSAQMGFMTPYVWMFISVYEKLRKFVIEKNTITSLIQLEYSGFAGATVPICTFTLQKGYAEGYKGGYIRLSDFVGADQQAPRALEALANPDCGWFYKCDSDSFAYVSGSPILYWAPQSIFGAFENLPEFGTVADARVGLITGDANRFLKRWPEVSLERISFGTKPGSANAAKWVPCTKGGEYRLWYGNNEYVVNWENDGWEMKNDNFDGDRVRAHNFNGEQAFKEGITWSTISSASFHCRYVPQGFMFDTAGPFCEIIKPELLWYSLGFMSSSMYRVLMGFLNPTMNFPPGYLQMVPFCVSKNSVENVSTLAKENVILAREDWDSFELSWDYSKHPLI